MPSPDPKQIVRQGYDKVSCAYRTDGADEVNSQYAQWLRELTCGLPVAAPVLDLGCGCGVPAARMLAHNFRVTGVDISPVQIQRASRLVPDAHFICADMTGLTSSPATFQAVACFYAIIHLPLDEQPAMLDRISHWLRPGGSLMITVGHTAWTGTQQDWLGVKGATMYWSHADAQTYREWLRAAGFTIASQRFVPEGDGGHDLILARAAPGP